MTTKQKTKIIRCSLCGGLNTTKKTCPLNIYSKNINYKKHINTRLITKINKLNNPRIVILDNDECIGQFGLFSVLYLFSRYREKEYPINLNLLMKSCVKYLFFNGLIRKDLHKLYKYLYMLKKKGKIDKVVMYTSASNNIGEGKSGYIYFLKKCLEMYGNCPKLYDIVLHRNNVKGRVAKDGSTIKDFANVLLNKKQMNIMYKNSVFEQYVNNQSTNIIMIDDKPENIKNRNGIKIKVKSYTNIPSPTNFIKCIESVPNLKSKFIRFKNYKKYINDITKKYNNNKQMTEDLSIEKIIEIINKYYNSISSFKSV